MALIWGGEVKDCLRAARLSASLPLDVAFATH